MSRFHKRFLGVAALFLLAFNALAQLPGGRWGAPNNAQNIRDAIVEDEASKSVDVQTPKTVYEIIVVDGSADRRYCRYGDSVTVVRNDTTPHYRFKEWTSDKISFDPRNRNADTLRFSMPAISGNTDTIAVTITANFVRLYQVTVFNGDIENNTTGGMFAAGDRVTVTANDSIRSRFHSWETEDGGLNVDGRRNPLTFDMPQNPVTLTATYIPVYQLTLGNGTIRGTNETSGWFAEDELVYIVADTKNDTLFKEWTFPNAPSASFILENGIMARLIMPAADITAAATYEAISQGYKQIEISVSPPDINREITVSVEDTEKTGTNIVTAEAAAQSAVLLSVSHNPDNYQFLKWSVTSGNVTITGNYSNRGAWFTMPDENVTIVAEFKFVINAPDGVDISWYEDNTSPYRIGTAAQLEGLRFLVNAGFDLFDGDTIKLTGNIDLAGRNWTPIGIQQNQCYDDNNICDHRPFRGVFDGDGKVISNLNINLSKTNVGLFGYIDGGTVQNLGVVDANVVGNIGVGGIAGYIVNGGTITRSYVTGSVTATNRNVGGIAGVVENSDISACYSTADVSAANVNIGGIAGIVIDGEIYNCYSTGSVIGSGNNNSSYVGGIAGAGSTGGDNRSSRVHFCGALNSAVTKGNIEYIGRVVGGYFNDLSNNGAFPDMLVNDTKISDPDEISSNEKHGANISVETIHAGGTIGGLFPESFGWKIADGFLPGLGDAGPVTMPCHLTAEGCPGTGAPPSAPAVSMSKSTTSSNIITVGPNPVSISAGSVGIFIDNSELTSTQISVVGNMYIYDASGNLVRRINAANVGGGNLPPPTPQIGYRQIAVWDLKDGGGRPVSSGTYLLRAVIKTSNGNYKKVSAVIGVR